jgi:hypothetical protein
MDGKEFIKKDISSMNGKEVLDELKTYKPYKNQTDYYIKKSIGVDKLATVDELKKELITLHKPKKLSKIKSHKKINKLEIDEPKKSSKTKSKTKLELGELKIPPNLQSITSLNVDYLSHLNYVDLKNLSVSNSSFKNILSNLSLKTILFNKLNIQVKENIADLMKELDDKIDALLKIHYVEFPRWVNPELFLNDQKSKIYKILPYAFYTKFQDYHIYKTKTFDDKMYESDMTLKIKLGKEILAFPFISNEYEVPDYDNEIPIHHTSLNLSKQFVEYIMNNMGKFIHWRDMEKRLEILFFTDN